jgi:hypothetical protein
MRRWVSASRRFERTYCLNIKSQVDQETPFLIKWLFWDVLQRWLVVSYRCFGTTYRSHFRDQRVLNPWRYCLTLENIAWSLKMLLDVLKILLDPWRYCLILENAAWPLKILLDSWRYCLILEDIAWSLKMLLDPWRYCLTLEDIVWSLKILLDPWRYCLTL